MKYRKKPIVIEAHRYLKPLYEFKTFEELPEWLKQARAAGDVRYQGNSKLVINTLEGEMTVSVGDYIIKGVAGELYLCKPDIFEQSYEVVG